MSLINNANLIAASEEEQTTLGLLNNLLEHSQNNGTSKSARLVAADGQELELSGSVVQVLQQVAKHLANGQAVGIIPNKQKLSSEEAATVLDVSHDYLLNLLERGEIPYTSYGSQRCIRFDDLMSFQQQWDGRMREGAAEIARISQEIGEVYD